MDGAHSKVYRELGGDTLVVANGGKITVEAGGEIDVSAALSPAARHGGRRSGDRRETRGQCRRNAKIKDAR